MTTKKIIRTLLSSVLIVSSVGVRAEESSQAPDFESDFYQAMARQTTNMDEGKSIIKEIPSGAESHVLSPACDPHRLEEAVLGKKHSTAEFYTITKNYFQKCAGELSDGTIKGILGLVRFSMFQYRFLSHPQISHIDIKLANGISVPGVLALKQDPRPRPLVILRCGVFCSANESASIKNYMMHLFDQSPFNVLILANQTGIDYLRQNRLVSLGGWSEGYENLEVAEWMRNKWDGRHRISSLHLMGISLGGNAAVFGAAYNDQFPLPDGKKIFNSVTAICPVISLRPTLDKLFGGTIIGPIFSAMTKNQFMTADQFNLDVSDMISIDQIPDRNGMADYIASLASTSNQRRGIASTEDSFYKSNNFFNLKEEVKTPLMVWASKDDMVVNNEINASTFAANEIYAKSKTAGVVNLSYGNHCGFSSVYGFGATAAVLRSFVMLHSPEFTPGMQTVKWTAGFPAMPVKYQHVGQEWLFSAGSNKATVNFKVFDGQSSACRDQTPVTAKGFCLRSYSFSLPIESLRGLGGRVPRNSIEAQALTREFNSKVEFRSAEGPINGTRVKDFSMTASAAFE